MSERKLLFMMNAEQAEAFARLVAAAGRGDGDAACRLGDMYREGLGGLRYSPKETYRWYAKSALAGDANGQNNLGACYEHGLGCAQSYPRAVKWYRLSAAQGLGTASMNLGYCYLRGHGVPSDKAEALRLFREAVERGEDKAATEVERLEGTRGLRVSQPVAADTPQVLPWRLGSRVPPRDGPLQQLRHPETAADEMSEAAHDQAILGDDTYAEQHQCAIERPPPWEDENVRHELLEILSAETADPADRADGPTDKELFPIFAEGGLKPDELVEGIAERYAQYLKQLPGD